MTKDILLKSVQIPNGETIGYRESGNGDKILVLIHGNMTSSKHWDLLIENLHEEYKIYALDLRGMGISTYNTPVNSVKDFSEDIKSVIDILGLKKFHLAGWSFGGAVSMQFAVDYAEYVEKLILVESGAINGYPMFKIDEKGQPILTERVSTREDIASNPAVAPLLYAYANKDKEFLKNIWRLTIYTENEPSPEKFDEYMDDMLTQRNLVDLDYSLLHFNISHEPNGLVPGSGEVDKITAPTLVIQGERDIVVPPYMGQGIKDGIGDNATLVILPCGHSPFIDCLDRIVEEFINFTK
jgi:pimeloyl-ACP methyl ester carboxylesterase